MRLSSIVKLKKNKFQFQAIQSCVCDKNSHGSGVAIYFRNTLNFEHRTDLKTDNLEMICIELKPKSLLFFWLGTDHQIMRPRH